MELEYTIKIRDSHNPPEFKEGLGKGVLVIQDVLYRKIKNEDDLKDPSFQRHIFEYSQELLEKWFEVVVKVKEKKSKKKK